MKSKTIHISVVPGYRPAKAIEARSSIELNNDNIATVFFEIVRNRLQHVNSWPIISESLASTFQLANKEGIEVYRKAQEGDFVKIVIESPESKNVSTADWVRIHSLTDLSNNEGIESFGFTLIKSEGPTNDRKHGDYHTNEAMCKFMVARSEKIVTTSIVEIDNPDRPDALPNTATNAAMGRLAHIDWQKLADGLISR